VRHQYLNAGGLDHHEEPSSLADEPMRLGREERQELVGYLSGEGLSTRAIAPIVGVDNATVHRDRARVANATPEVERPAPAEFRTDEMAALVSSGFVESVEDLAEIVGADPETGVIEDAEIVEDEPQPTKVTGLDGKTYTRPEPKPDRRRSLVHRARVSVATG